MDNKKEYWDAYDINCKKVPGIILEKGDYNKIPDGMFHIICGIIIKHKDGTFLLTQRDQNKSNPLKWDLSVNGSVLKDETPIECAKREIKEETGIECLDFERIGMLVSPKDHAIYINFVTVTNCKKDNLKIQKGETAAFKWIGKFELNNPEKLNLSSDNPLKALKQTEYYDR